MRVLAPLDTLAFAELLDLCHDEPSSTPYAPNGSFVRQRRGGRDYWYFRGYEKPPDGSVGRPILRYAGRAGDPPLDQLVADHASLHARYRKRRELASRLRRAGLPQPLPLEAAITRVLAEAGLFRQRSTLVGSVAFQTFAGLLGVKFDEGAYRTQDVDVAQPLGLRIGSPMPARDLYPALKAADPTFEPLFHPAAASLVCGYRNASNFKVEFIVPRRGERHGTTMIDVAGLPGVGAQPLAFREYLLENPARSVMLADEGIAVSVPDPLRYAVHKLMVSVLRRLEAPGMVHPKAVKDIAQSEAVIAAARHVRAETALGEIGSRLGAADRDGAGCFARAR